MKLALVADIHANLEGLRACLDHAQSQGAERYAFLGDLVGYGADPGPVVDLVRGYVDRGALAVMGNHDAAALAGKSEFMHQAAVQAIPESPSEWIYVTDPARAAQALAHAAPASWVFCSHVHGPVLYTLGAGARPVPFRPVSGVAIPVPAHRRWVAVVGSAGQPRDGNTAACYAMLDTDRPALTFHRVPYDWRPAAAKIRAAGLPEGLARRLERGE